MLQDRKSAVRRPNPPRIRTASLAILLIAAVAAGCGRGDDQAAGQQSPGSAKAAAGQHPGGQKPPSGPPVAVAVRPASVGAISSYYRATASLDANNEAEVLARVDGVVLALLCEEGDHVEKGQVLLRIEPEEYQIKVRQAEAEAATQKTRFERAQKMWDQKLISAEEFEAAENDYQGAQAALDLAKLQLSYTEVRAPFSGRVVRRSVDVGRTVSVGTSLFLVADLDKLLARVHVPAKEFRHLQTDQAVELSLDSNQETLNGKIALISPVIDPSTGTIKITVEIDHYPESIRPGDFAEVSVVTERRDHALLVPKASVVTEKGESFVYVAADSTAERRAVETGFQDKDHAEIVSGLQAGEDVVVQGQRSLEDGTRIKIMDEMKFDRTRENPEPTS